MSERFFAVNFARRPGAPRPVKKKKDMPQTTRNKALLLNQDQEFYGSFAEIGAGQEVARHFFQAGLASQTVAKSMSAYDKVFSDAIYGKGSRFVSQDRLVKMLDHEFRLLDERLNERAPTSSFFAFANTVATSSHEDHPTCHGWMGIRFQTQPKGKPNEIILHVRMLDRLRLQQQETLGILGVNLIYGARRLIDTGAHLIESLLENLTVDRVEIDYIKFDGPDLKHIDNRLMSLELVNQNMSHAVMFDPAGNPLCPSDALYRKHIFVQRGTFRPVTNTNMDILDRGLKHFLKDCGCKKDDVMTFFEMTMSGLKRGGAIDPADFLNRVDTIGALGQRVLVTNFQLFSDLAEYLRKKTDLYVGLVVGALLLNNLMDPKFYEGYRGGMLSALAKLFEASTRVYVYPYKTEAECTTAAILNPKGAVKDLYRYFLATQKIVDIADCDAIDTGLRSETVRELLEKGDKAWEKLVPPAARELIKKRKMFV
jgi:hypothetical protein